MPQVSEGVLPADDAFNDAVVRLDVGVLFWRCRSRKLMLNTVSVEVFAHEVGNKLAAIVATHRDLRYHRQAELDVLKQRHNIFFLDTPLHQPADIKSALDIEHRQHHGIAATTVDRHVLDIELKVR